MHHKLQAASTENLQQLLPLVQAYHQFEDIHMTDENRKQAVSSLISDSSLGGVWLIAVDDEIAGYIALTFGYSIEFGGRDAFIDEFYIRSEFRGQGLGKHTLRQIQEEVKALHIQALHLEVAQFNIGAQRLYNQAGFQTRTKYRLMSARLDCPS